MAPPLLNPVSVPVGQSVHLTFVDQLGVQIDQPDSASIFPNPTGNPPLPVGVVSIAYDADLTGATITGLAVGNGWVYLKATKGNTTVTSVQFQIVVPWAVTAIGTVSP